MKEIKTHGPDLAYIRHMCNLHVPDVGQIWANMLLSEKVSFPQNIYTNISCLTRCKI